MGSSLPAIPQGLIFAVLIVIIGVTFGIFGDKQQGAAPVVETADNGGDFDEF